MKRVPLVRRTPLRSRTRRKADRAAWAAAMTAADWRCRVVRDGRRCPSRATQVHHVLPRSSGGSDDPSNLLATCAPCHAWIHDHPQWAETVGYLRRATTHVRRFVG